MNISRRSSLKKRPYRVSLSTIVESSEESNHAAEYNLRYSRFLEEDEEDYVEDEVEEEVVDVDDEQNVEEYEEEESEDKNEPISIVSTESDDTLRNDIDEPLESAKHESAGVKAHYNNAAAIIEATTLIKDITVELQPSSTGSSLASIENLIEATRDTTSTNHPSSTIEIQSETLTYYYEYNKTFKRPELTDIDPSDTRKASKEDNKENTVTKKKPKNHPSTFNYQDLRINNFNGHAIEIDLELEMQKTKSFDESKSDVDKSTDDSKRDNSESNKKFTRPCKGSPSPSCQSPPTVSAATSQPTKSNERLSKSSGSKSTLPKYRTSSQLAKSNSSRCSIPKSSSFGSIKSTIQRFETINQKTGSRSISQGDKVERKSITDIKASKQIESKIASLRDKLNSSKIPQKKEKSKREEENVPKPSLKELKKIFETHGDADKAKEKPKAVSKPTEARRLSGLSTRIPMKLAKQTSVPSPSPSLTSVNKSSSAEIVKKKELNGKSSPTNFAGSIKSRIQTFEKQQSPVPSAHDSNKRLVAQKSTESESRARPTFKYRESYTMAANASASVTANGNSNGTCGTSATSSSSSLKPSSKLAKLANSAISGNSGKCNSSSADKSKIPTVKR